MLLAAVLLFLLLLLLPLLAPFLEPDLLVPETVMEALMGTHLVAVDDFGVGVLFFFFLVASKSSIEIVETGISVGANFQGLLVGRGAGVKLTCLLLELSCSCTSGTGAVAVFAAAVSADIVGREVKRR